MTMIKDRAALLESNTSLCFDDILLVPEYSDLESRSVPSLEARLGHLVLGAPIVSAPMDSITGLDMLLEMAEAGGLGILTRFIDGQNLRFMCEVNGLDVVSESLLHVKIISDARVHLDHLSKHRPDSYRSRLPIGCAIGIKEGVVEHSQVILEAGCDVICLDVAHGDHSKMYQAIEKVSTLKKRYKFSLMAGNVCTPAAAKRFQDAGVDIIKVGIGPGAACTTRRVTGFGMPQLTAVLQCREACDKAYILADGGLRTTGDMIKVMWAGADACMSGYMLAGTSATPDIDNSKMYRGMSSRTVHQRKDVAAEGIDMKVHYQGKTSVKIEEYKQGLQSGLAMAGARNFQELRKAKCTQVSVFTMKESEPVV